jgi:hypothetical protein
MFLERPYLNYEFYAPHNFWWERFKYPELELEDGSSIIEKFNPKKSARKGYVHMFPCFYKYCLKFDMDKFPKTFWEEKILKYVCKWRKYFLTLLELFGLSVYYYYVETKQLALGLTSLPEVIAELIILVFALLILNHLSYKIYAMMELGWQDMHFKLEGIRQTTNMLSIVDPSILENDDDDYRNNPEKTDKKWYEIWPFIPPMVKYDFQMHELELDQQMDLTDLLKRNK